MSNENEGYDVERYSLNDFDPYRMERDALRRQLAEREAECARLREALKQQPCICTPGGNGCIRCAALSESREEDSSDE